MSAYIIPPYLLNTSFGSQLQHQLEEKDVELSETNEIALDSRLFESFPEIPVIPPYKFSSNGIINEIIKEKLVYKLGIIGVLGSSPKPMTQFSDEEAFELFESFKHRLLTEDKQDPDVYKSTLYDSDKFGEVTIYENNHIPTKYKRYLTCTLKQLLLISKLEANSQINSKPSFLKFGDDNYFQYNLPSSWVSLVPSSMLGTINDRMELSTNHDGGFCNIELKTLKNPTSTITTKPGAGSGSKYFNFVSNQSITPSVGIFYYEVEIIQKCRDSTNMLPLLSIQDSSISTNQSPQCSVGIVKRFVNYNSKPNHTTPIHHKIDLEEVKNELVFNQDNIINRPLNISIETLLDAKPGEFKGSYAIDLADSNFYNSSKLTETRSSFLSMNRRIGSLTRQVEDNDGKIDTSINFTTSVENNPDCKVLKSDVVGFGINYIDKSLFITLNGVLIKVVKDELKSTNPLQEDLFSEGSEVYPMVGFILNDIDIKTNRSSEVKLQTNLGFKDFKFNINNYVSEYKHKLARNLNVNLLNYPDNKIILNDLIKDYLNTEGYIETYKTLNNDLNELNTILGVKEQYDNTLIDKSDGTNRNLLKRYFQEYKFDSILWLLKSEYSNIFNDNEGANIIFEVKLNSVVYRLKTYIQKLLATSIRDEFEYRQIWAIITQLQNEYNNDQVKFVKIKSVAVLLLVNNEKSLDNLPNIKNVLKNLDQEMDNISSKVNRKILKWNKLKETSNLEKLVRTVNTNINKLNVKLEDSNYSLINFERDELEF